VSDDQDLLVEFDTLRQASVGISQTIDEVRKLSVSKIVGPTQCTDTTVCMARSTASAPGGTRVSASW